MHPRADETVEVNPLVPDGAWDYFYLDQIRYHGHWLTVLYDNTGTRYGKGRGLRVLADGKEIAAADVLSRVTGQLPSSRTSGAATETTAGWVKYAQNPVLGGQYGTCFDISVLKDGDRYRMWVSWRPKKSVALVESADGLHWNGPPRIVLRPRPETGWEDDINRPVVLKRADGYHLWYTAQTHDRSWIGYATSPDGLHWIKRADNPVFKADPASAWEKHKVTACQVISQGDWHLMFYIGFRDVDHAQIGVARSRNGITDWQRHPANPIIRPGQDQWDHDACYKPFAIFDGTKWLLWYNGRHGSLEQIGVVFHEGPDLGFE